VPPSLMLMKLRRSMILFGKISYKNHPTDVNRYINMTISRYGSCLFYQAGRPSFANNIYVLLLRYANTWDICDSYFILYL